MDLVLTGLHQFHHHTDDMARGAELAVVARCGHLPQHILIHIAHRIAVVHIKLIHAFHYLDEGSGIGDKERGVLHEAAVCAFPALVEVLDEDEGILADGLEHPLRLEVHKVVPTKIGIGHITIGIGVVPRAILEDGIGDGGAQ